MEMVPNVDLAVLALGSVGECSRETVEATIEKFEQFTGKDTPVLVIGPSNLKEPKEPQEPQKAKEYLECITLLKQNIPQENLLLIDHSNFEYKGDFMYTANHLSQRVSLLIRANGSSAETLPNELSIGWSRRNSKP